MKCVFITGNIDINYGGGIVTFRNLKFLEEFGIEVIKIFLVKDKKKYLNSKYNIYIQGSKNKIDTFLNSVKLYIGNLSSKAEKEVIKEIKKNKIDFIFYDGSYYGRVIKKIKKYNSNIKHITFFHNVEQNFTKALIEKDGIKYISIYFASIFNEYLSVKYSDILITLNEIESNELKKIYGRKADYILPISLEDKFNETKIIDRKEKKLKLLFIGSYFFANYYGIKWFIENVMNNIINAKLYIVGKGFENKKLELESKNVEVIGSCNDIEKFYYDSDIIVSPIFSGAGMKVKIAEALMYGKTILGTSKAFEGYEIEDFNKIGGLCDTKEEYIEKINFFFNYKNFKRLNDYSRKIFLEKYSNNSIRNIMKNIIKNI